MNSISRATEQYEAWLAKHTNLVEADLARKHEQMTSGLFPFFRATYYRWAQHWPVVCAELATAREVLAVGDLHVENFGTWRDDEGRLVWGVNDFDEAYPLAYTNDLVRLAASALVAIDESHLKLPAARACDAIVAGYSEGVKAGGAPFVLAEQHGWLRRLASGSLRDPAVFWRKLDELVPVHAPKNAREVLETVLPEPGIEYRVVPRVAGEGSLGHQRFVAVAAWQGASIAREAKARAPSASEWVNHDAETGDYYRAIMRRAVRTPDPLLVVRKRWVLRRLAPDCSRVELAALPKQRDEGRLLHAMGWETANVHLGSAKAAKGVLRDVRRRPQGWLLAAALSMVEAMASDWEEWKLAQPPSPGQRS